MPVYKNNTEKSIVENFKDEHNARISFTIEPGKSLSTEFLLTNPNLTLISAAPYFNPLQAATHTVESTGVGDDQTISIDLLTKTIAIINQSSVMVTAFLRSTSNVPGLFCYPSTERIISVGHNVDQIVFQFAGEATIYVEERE